MLWDCFFVLLMVVAVGVFITGLFFYFYFLLFIVYYGQMEMIDIFSGVIVAVIAIAAGMVAVWCLLRLYVMMY